MAKAEIVEEFTHRGRLCIIIKIDWGVSNDFPILKRSSVYHCGYVESFSEDDPWEDPKYNEITADEMTYASYSVQDKHEEKLFIGFDSNHYWNWEEPESQSHQAVKERLIKFADEVIEIEEHKINTD